MSLPRLQAPQENGAVLAVPSLDRAPDMIAENRQRFDACGLNLLGRPFCDLRRLARQEALAQARTYLHCAGEPVPEPFGNCLILAGHQPELTHPGVWVKHFAIQNLARRNQGSALNLMVDNDTAKSTVLRLPAGDHLAYVPFDHWKGEVPYEERIVLDEGFFASLPDRSRERTESWPFQSMLPEFWTEVCRHVERTDLLGERLAAARRTYERKWNCHNLELPLSQVCRTEAFAWFASHLLQELPRFQAIYNRAVEEYRILHGIRSRNHPVPDLSVEGDWLEAPFWVWRTGQSQRQRLLVRAAGVDLHLRFGSESLILSGCRQSSCFLSAWKDIREQGIKIRTRALTTTMYARLFLADLFVHGIGGGIYDELTDNIIQRFYGVNPPHFLILSATLMLPFPHETLGPETCRDQARLVRDLYFSPQRFLDGTDPAAAALAIQKQAWIERPCFTHAQRRDRFLNLRRLTEKLRPFLAGRREETNRIWKKCEDQWRRQQIQSRRDFSFCLFPEEVIRPFCQRFLEI